MRKVSVSMLVLLVLLTLLGVPFVVSAKGTTGLSSDPLATRYAHPDFIRKSKTTISPDIAGISPSEAAEYKDEAAATQRPWCRRGSAQSFHGRVILIPYLQ